ncbi:hypothetical protein Cadr_000026077 [Camelus dromedarius]|uniref:Uncharacterized protein n=1 Tax=Camelus dromedarius TaxID=9838 RepID=A0A5N4CEA3_CAMDR|nr:hypothetical protein Cadr_000026077 [Camelus dromedarius]
MPYMRFSLGARSPGLPGQISPSLFSKTVCPHIADDESHLGRLLKIQPPRSLPLKKLIQWLPGASKAAKPCDLRVTSQKGPGWGEDFGLRLCFSLAI